MRNKLSSGKKPGFFVAALAGLFSVAILGAGTGRAAQPPGGEVIDYSRDIAPILSARCYACHGPDAGQRQAGLRLDIREDATRTLESGHRAIVPGDPAASQLVARITSVDDATRMPPPEANQVVTADELNKLRLWIQQGAAWSGHWSFEPLTASPPPPSTRPNAARHPVDRFVLARLTAAGISPAPQADRATLARRLSFDLTGLPPSPDMVDAFLHDKSPDAYQRLVDRMLSSPRYGERWGRHWLDVARYGDSNGGDENHYYPHAFRYRDWVIDALNRDLTYDRFMALQIAGDLFPVEPHRTDGGDLAATGFLAIGMKILAEQDPVKMRVDMIDEQLDTFGRAFLGLAIGCARCHDHKFDPIPTRDYYALAGIFHSTNVMDRPLQTEAYRRASQAHERQVGELKSAMDALEQEINQQLAGKPAIVRQAESFDRGNVITDDTNYGKGIGIISDPGSQENFAEFDIQVPEAGTYVVQLRYAASSPRPGRLIVNTQVINDRAISQATGSWLPDTQTWFTEGSCSLPKGKTTVRLESKPLMSHIDQLRLLPADKASDLQDSLTRQQQLADSLAELEKQAPAAIQAMAVADGTVADVRIHRRGSHLDLGSEVPRGFLSALRNDGALPPTSGQSGRAELTRWLIDPASPAAQLASRVIVNRLWHWHFGRGLVTTPDDFGTRGRRPTHPQLLDYLAGRLIDDGWSLKRIHRLIVTSQTYRMASDHRSSRARKRDPENRWLWRQRTRRLDAESIRDAMLAVSGELDLQIGGQPPKVKSGDPSPADLAANRHVYDQSRRRSVYLPVVRSNIYEFFTLFDFPNATTPVGRRAETILPTQALFTMNSPVFLQTSQQLAERTLAERTLESQRQRICWLIGRLFARQPRPGEVALLERFLSRYRATHSESEDSEVVHGRAWQAMCQVLIQSNEFVYVR